MKVRDIVLAIVVIILLLILFQRIRNSNQPPTLSDQEVPIENVEKNMEDILGTQIPDDVEKASLKPESGVVGQGIVTRDTKNDKLEISVLADLPDLEEGQTYQAWMKENDDSNPVSMGILQNRKGGWILDYSSDEIVDVKNVIVSRETKVDTNLETPVLTATFSQ